MTPRSSAALFFVAALATACQSGDAGSTAAFESAAIDTEDQKASYGIGLNIGGQIADAESRIDRMALMRGIEDALQGNEPDIPPAELQSVLQAFSQQIQEAAAAERESAATENLAAGEAYLAENGARSDVTTTASGLQYEVLRAGEGASPTVDQRARLHYRGTLIDGTEFDSSYDGDPAEFAVGGLIPGFTEALTLMSPGSHFRIVIPSDIAYGPRGSGRVIGPNATLIFEIELIEVIG
jgi:FKBP-type peptidyl-prolyl cis-trans isomerase